VAGSGRCRVELYSCNLVPKEQSLLITGLSTVDGTFAPIDSKEK
jgi:hypothetical protein